VLNRLVTAGRLTISYKSNSTTQYRLIEQDQTFIEETPQAPWPNDLFSVVVGQTQAVATLTLALEAERAVHVLLHGPPGTAKSLLLEEVARLPNSYTVLGATSSRAGLARVLIDVRPSYLIVDEIDKGDREDLTILLRLMEAGEVIYTKRGFTEREAVDCRVFASANSLQKLPRELLDRFVVRQVPAYRPDEYREVVEKVLVGREGVAPDLAQYIAAQVAGRTESVRYAVQVARMARTAPEVDRVLETLS
jgi:Holliday junction DNA helicase RuvB